MSQLGAVLRTQREPRRSTILGLLTEQMDGVDSGTRRRRSFKERFGFIGMGCCGATWGFRSDALSVTQGEQQQQETDPECVGPAGLGSGMNLAAALAAERQLRGPQEEAVRAPGTPWRVSLMRLLEETEAEKEKEKEKEDIEVL